MSIVNNLSKEPFSIDRGGVINMLKNLFTVLIVCMVFSIFVMPAHARDVLKYNQQIYNKSIEIKKIESQISYLESDYSKVSSRHELLKMDVQDKKEAYAKAKDAYTRASQNVDIISPEQLSQFLRDYKNAGKDLKASNSKLKGLENNKRFIESKIIRLKIEKKEKYIAILAIKAEVYEKKLREAVWVEGTGECILDENKTMKECRHLALDYAKRDAIEKGGKSLIESVTEVVMFELTKDDIKETIKVNIVAQVTSGDFGKSKRVISGDIIKYIANVRLKIQSVATYNPYRESIKELKANKAEVPPVIVIPSLAQEKVPEPIPQKKIPEPITKKKVPEPITKKDVSEPILKKKAPGPIPQKKSSEPTVVVPLPSF